MPSTPCWWFLCARNDFDANAMAPAFKTATMSAIAIKKNKSIVMTDVKRSEERVVEFVFEPDDFIDELVDTLESTIKKHPDAAAIKACKRGLMLYWEPHTRDAIADTLAEVERLMRKNFGPIWVHDPLAHGWVQPTPDAPRARKIDVP